MTTKISLADREAMAVKRALEGSQSLDYLLPFKEICITRDCNEKNVAVGNILDDISRRRFEWYGYSLAEKNNASLIVDTLIQPNQVVTGGEVTFKPIQAKQALDELYRRNKRERREGTGRELMMVGIVHRHGFEKDVPYRSSKDVKNLSDYIHWMSVATEKLSTHQDSFDGMGNFDAILNGDTLDLSGKKADEITIRYTLGSESEERNFLLRNGINPELFDEMGGFRGLLKNHLIWRGQITGLQNRYVSTATSIIYNQDGRKRFGEIILLAKGAINGSYENPFVVEINTEPTENVSVSLSELEKEVAKKIHWKKKHHAAHGGWKGLAETPTILLKKDGIKTDFDLSSQFYHTACAYLVNCRDTEAKYSGYLQAMLTNLAEQNSFLTNAVIKTGTLRPDKLDENGQFPKPQLDAYAQSYLPSKTYLSEDSQRKTLERSLIENFSGAELTQLNRTLEDHIPKIISKFSTEAKQC